MGDHALERPCSSKSICGAGPRVEEGQRILYSQCQALGRGTANRDETEKAGEGAPALSGGFTSRQE